MARRTRRRRRSPIRIKKKNRGKLTAQAKRRGMSALQFARKVKANPKRYSAATRKRATFALNASKWRKKRKRRRS